jgi:hypothetical protein
VGSEVFFRVSVGNTGSFNCLNSFKSSIFHDCFGTFDLSHN